MPDYEQIVSDAFGAPCKIEYGSVECGILALQNQKGGLEVQDISRFVETVPRDDGFFDIVVTVLDNPAFPLLRYRIGDTTSTAVIRGSNGTTMLKDVLGRSNDFLVTREGGHVHANAVKHAMEQVVKIKRFRAIQNAQGNLEVLVEHDSALESQVRKKMENRLEAILQGYSATVNQVPLIPGNVAGKHLWLTSELYAEECKRN